MLHSCGATRLGACTPARRRTIIRPPLITEGTPSPLLSRRASVRFALESPFVPVHAPRFHHSAALFAMGCGEYFSFSQVWLYHSRALKSCQSLFLPFSAKYIQNTIPANRVFTLNSRYSVFLLRLLPLPLSYDIINSNPPLQRKLIVHADQVRDRIPRFPHHTDFQVRDAGHSRALSINYYRNSADVPRYQSASCISNRLCCCRCACRCMGCRINQRGKRISNPCTKGTSEKPGSPVSCALVYSGALLSHCRSPWHAI